MKISNKNLTKVSLPCFYCNVDSTELKAFVILVIGGLVAASVFIFLGAWAKGAFKNTEKIKENIFEYEGRE